MNLIGCIIHINHTPHPTIDQSQFVLDTVFRLYKKQLLIDMSMSYITQYLKTAMKNKTRIHFFIEQTSSTTEICKTV